MENADAHFGISDKRNVGYTGNIKPLSPVLAEDRVIQDNLLQELDELVGKVGGHEGLDCDRDLLWILGLRQGRLDNLQRGTTDDVLSKYLKYISYFKMNKPKTKQIKMLVVKCMQYEC